jgi:membrane protein
VSAGLGIAAIPLTTLANVGLFMVAFRVLTAREVPTRHLRIGAVVAGVGWQIVQVLGTYFVAHTLRGAPEAYGVFGLVLGLIAWIYLLALVIVFAAEVNVVAQRRLWPRALLTPFTRPSAADLGRRARLHRIRRERAPQRVEIVDVGFEPPEEETDPHDGGEPGR